MSDPRLISLEELTSKILTNTILADKAVEDEDKEKVFKNLDSRMLMRGLIGFLGRPIVYSTSGINVFSRDKLYYNETPSTKYWFAWAPSPSMEVIYDPLDCVMPQRFNKVKPQPNPVPTFERVSVRKRIHIIEDASVGFDYFFSTDQNKGFLMDINSSINLGNYKHHTFFPKYHGILNRVKRGYRFERSTFEQGIRIVRGEFMKEMRKLLISEQAYKPILR